MGTRRDVASRRSAPSGHVATTTLQRGPFSRCQKVPFLLAISNPEHGAMVGDELDHRGYVLRRSSSAWAKYANAFRRISFARFSSRTSRSSSFNRSRSLVVRPGRCPASRCACRTHFRSVSAVQPSFGATDCSTAHSEAWASRCSSTIRTARSRTSGENRLGRPIDPILPSNEVSEKPGTIQFPFIKGLDSFDFGYQPSVDRKQIQKLSLCHFVEHGENLVLLGPPGVGKTHLAVGLGLKAIEHGYRVLFTTAAAMLTTLTKTLSEGRFDDKLKSGVVKPTTAGT